MSTPASSDPQPSTSSGRQGSFAGDRVSDRTTEVDSESQGSSHFDPCYLGNRDFIGDNQQFCSYCGGGEI